MSGVIAAAGITAAAGLAGGLLGKGGVAGGGSGGGYGGGQQQLSPGNQQQYDDNWDLAVQAANQLMGPYSGQRVAGLTGEQQELIRQLYGNVGSTNAAFDQASGLTNGLAGYQARMINPQTLAGTNLSPYMNPYTQSVIDPSLKALEQSRLQSLNTIGQQATAAKAFGGSRQGIAEASTNAQTAANAGQLSANLWSQNFNQAQNAAVGDISRDLTAQQSNQTADANAATFRANMANQIANLASQKQQNWLTGVQQAMGGQQILQTNEQAQLDAARQYYMEQRQQPLDVLQIRQNALGLQPNSLMNYGGAPVSNANPWATGFGTAATTAGILGQMGMWNSSSPYGTTSDPRSIASPQALSAWNNSLSGFYGPGNQSGYG